MASPSRWACCLVRHCRAKRVRAAPGFRTLRLKPEREGMDLSIYLCNAMLCYVEAGGARVSAPLSPHKTNRKSRHKTHVLATSQQIYVRTVHRFGQKYKSREGSVWIFISSLKRVLHFRPKWHNNTVVIARSRGYSFTAAPRLSAVKISLVMTSPRANCVVYLVWYYLEKSRDPTLARVLWARKTQQRQRATTIAYVLLYLVVSVVS